jgi:hypothetical protein
MVAATDRHATTENGKAFGCGVFYAIRAEAI